MNGQGTGIASGQPRAMLAGLPADLAPTIAQVAATLGFAVNDVRGPGMASAEAHGLLQGVPPISLLVLGASSAMGTDHFPVEPPMLIDAMAAALSRQAVGDAVAVVLHDQAARTAAGAQGEQALFDSALRAAIPVLARRHAPRLRVNAVLLRVRALGGPSAAAVARAVRLIATCPSMTGQAINLAGESAVQI